MPPISRLLALTIVLTVGPLAGAAAENASPALKPLGEVLVAGIQQRLRDPAVDLTDFEADIQALETLIEQRGDARTQELGQVRFMHAILVGRIQRDHARALTLLEGIAADFVNTELGDEMMPHLRREWYQIDEMKRAADRIGQPAPALNFTWCSDDSIQSLADLRGRVVVIDFWTTFEASYGHSYGKAFMNIRDLVGRFSERNFTYLGVTSIQGGVHGVDEYVIDCADDPEREYELMEQFIEKNDVTWTIAFSEDDVHDRRFSVWGLPFTVIIDANGVVRRSDGFAAVTFEERAQLVEQLLAEAAASREDGDR